MNRVRVGVACGALLMIVAISTGTRAPKSAAASILGTRTPHLVVVVMENKESTDIIGNANALYINETLVPLGRSFSNAYAAAHPSLPNYLILTSGQYGSCVDDACARGVLSWDNIFHQMNSTVPAITWKVYAESMPSNCYPSNSGPYVVRHNPPVYYTNLGPSGDNSCATKNVPFTTINGDISAATLPAFAMVIPNQYNDMHSDHKVAPCQLGVPMQDQICQGDTWLKANLPPILSDGGRNDVTALVLFDEGRTSRGGGGHIVAIEVGPTVCTGCSDTTAINHYGIVNGIERWFALPELHQAVPSF